GAVAAAVAGRAGHAAAVAHASLTAAAAAARRAAGAAVLGVVREALAADGAAAGGAGRAGRPRREAGEVAAARHRLRDLVEDEVERLLHVWRVDRGPIDLASAVAAAARPLPRVGHLRHRLLVARQHGRRLDGHDVG